MIFIAIRELAVLFRSRGTQKSKILPPKGFADN